MSAVGLAEASYPEGRLTIRGADSVLASRRRFGELMEAAQATYLPTLIDMPAIRPRFVRGPRPLGSSPLAWADA